MYGQILKALAVSEIKNQGKKLRDKDANNTGGDDAGGRALEAIAEGIDAMDLSGITNPKSLRNIGKALEAAGKQIQAEAEKM